MQPRGHVAVVLAANLVGRIQATRAARVDGAPDRNPITADLLRVDRAETGRPRIVGGVYDVGAIFFEVRMLPLQRQITVQDLCPAISAVELQAFRGRMRIDGGRVIPGS